MERFSLKNISEVEGEELYQVKIKNSLAAVENLDDDVDINKAWESIRENINILPKESLSYYEMK
jgi:hypothetical protein